MLLKKAIILSVLCLFFNHSFSQDQVLFEPITINFNSITVDSALNLIGRQINYNFTYNSNYTSADIKVKAEFTQMPLSIVLDSLFSDPFLNYKILDRQVVVFKEEATKPLPLETDPKKETLKKSFTLKGKVIDARSKKPIPFAAIGFKNKSIGTVSNSNGNFVLNYDKHMLQDTLLISHLGYSQLSIPVKQLDTAYTFHLHQHSISLQEVIIRSTDPSSLIETALDKRFHNYDNNPFIHRAFYRETIKRNDRYMIYTEAIFDIFKSAYRPTIHRDQLKLIKQRKFTDVNSKDTVLFKLHGGLSTSLFLDVLKHPIDFLDKEHINEYNYFIRDVVLIENELAYLIEFKPKNRKNEMAFDGEVYININSLAILKVSFNFTRESIKKLKNSFIVRQSRTIKAHPVDAEYSITYKKNQNGLYYINHIKGCLRLRVKKKRKLLSSTYETAFEMITTDLNTNNVSRFSRKETLSSKKIFSDLSTSYNPEYWINENFILPEDDLTKALSRFKHEELSLENK